MDLPPLLAPVVDDPVKADRRSFGRTRGVHLVRWGRVAIVAEFGVTDFMGDEKCLLKRRGRVFVDEALCAFLTQKNFEFEMVIDLAIEPKVVSMRRPRLRVHLHVASTPARRSGVPATMASTTKRECSYPGHRPTFVGHCSSFQRIIWDNVSSDVFVSMVKVRRVVHGAYSFLRALPLRNSHDGLFIHTRPGKIPTIAHASKLAGDDRRVVVLGLLTRAEIRHIRIG